MISISKLHICKPQNSILRWGSAPQGDSSMRSGSITSSNRAQLWSLSSRSLPSNSLHNISSTIIGTSNSRYSHVLSHLNPYGVQKRSFFSSNAILQSDSSTLDPEEKQRKRMKRYMKAHKKTADAKGRAFKDTKGFRGAHVAKDAKISEKRALRVAKKLEPKNFSGKVAVYLGAPTNLPFETITEENLHLMPNPNQIRAPKSIVIDENGTIPEEHQHIIDLIREDQDIHSLLSNPAKYLEKQKSHNSEQKESVISPKPKTEKKKEKKVLSKEEEEEDDMLEEEDDLLEEDDQKFDISKNWMSSDDEMMSELSKETQEAVTKVRKIFSGSISWHQPNPGDLEQFFSTLRQRRKIVPAARSSLTSATTFGIKSILGEGKNVGPLQGAAPSPALFGNKQTLLERSASKTNRSAQENLGILHDALKLPQVCVIGRSNVGKSSLLNALMGSNVGLLKVSKVPGRTQTIQMVEVSEKLVVVDMPGYGYARVTPQLRKEIERRVAEYLDTGLPRRVFILIDSRRGLSNADVALADSLEKRNMVYQLVLTKMDKSTNLEKEALLEKDLMQWVTKRPKAFPNIIKTSSKDRFGIDQMRVAVYTACGYEL